MKDHIISSKKAELSEKAFAGMAVCEKSRSFCITVVL